MRKDLLVNGSYYHILNRSIAQYEIFKEADDCVRFLQILDLYHYENFTHKYSNFLELTTANQGAIIKTLKNDSPKFVQIVAYCIMPTHFHLVLGQISNKGISKFMAKVLNSYSRYFNLRYKRKGPLWEGHFKNVLVNSDEQLLHLTRYIHLNPVSVGLIKKPEDWAFSSYPVYLNIKTDDLCEYDGLFNISSKEYKKFVNSRISYQKELSRIKSILMEGHTG